MLELYYTKGSMILCDEIPQVIAHLFTPQNYHWFWDMSANDPLSTSSFFVFYKNVSFKVLNPEILIIFS